MSFMGGLFGGSGGNEGSAGLNYNAAAANVIQPTDANQIGQAYNQAQGGIGMQGSFYNQLAGQNGIGNQSSVFNQQQGLANMLGMQAMGYGPNPALAQLNQTTGQNVAQQNALMAGQRGSGSNSGLLARQAAMQGAGIQQNAVGQAAVMRAQQQLGAQQALQGQQANMANLATQQIGQQAGALNNYNQAAQSEQQALLGSLGNYNNANVSMQSNQNNANAGISQIAAKGQQGLVNMVGLGGLQGFGLAKGGMVGNNYASGGVVNMPAPEMEAPSSFAIKYLRNPGQSMPVQNDMGVMAPAPDQQSSQGMSAAQSGFSKAFESDKPATPATPQAKADGGAIQPIEKNPDDSPRVQQDEDSGGAMKLLPFLAALLAKGGQPMVPGTATVGGDSLKNDKVPAMLSPKEIVIPRSITLSKNAPEKAKQFVAAILARNGMKR